MADVTTTFAAKDESFASTVDKLSGRLQGFQGQTQSFTSRVGEMAKGFAAFVGPIAAVGAAFLGARGIVNSFRDAIDMGGKLNDLSARTGETAGNLAVLQRAFENAGSSGEAVGPMLNRLQRFMVEAGQGSKAQVEAMDKLGLSYEQLKTMTPTAQMELLAQKISAIPDPAQRSALAMEIFGRSGGELMPLLRNMSGELETARAQLGGYPEAMDRANKALDDIGDSFGAISTKAREFVTGALVDIAPTIAAAADQLAKMDFASMGMKLSQTLQQVYNFFVGLWQNPGQIFGTYVAFLNAFYRQLGDNLLSAFLTAGNALSSFLNQLVETGAFSKLGDVLANAFIYATQRFNLLMFDAITSVVNFFGNVWNSATSQGASGLAKKLLDVVKFFASDFVQAMTNPAAFIGNKISAALLGATKSAAEDYRFSFDSATGSYVEKARAGLQAVVDGSGSRLQQSAAAFGNSLVTAATNTAAQAEIVKVNLFGGAEAIAQVNERVAAIASAGEQFRGPVQESVEPAEAIGEAIGTLPESGKSLYDALALSFPWADSIRREAQAMAAAGALFHGNLVGAAINAHVTANVLTGLSKRMHTAVNATNSMLDQMREAFYFGRETTQETMARLQQGGMGLVDAAHASAEVQNQQNTLDAEYRDLERQAKKIEDEHARKMRQAAELDKTKQEKSAEDLRNRANAERVKAQEALNERMLKAADETKKLLVESGKLSGEALNDGAQKGGAAVQAGGEAAAQALHNAAAALRGGDDGKQFDGLALETTLQACRDFLNSIDKKLPQHALT
jgi:hypothetical protein